MSGEFLVTIGDVSNLPGMFNGPFLKGRREPRIAFVGRSNVGKSTLINALIGQRLARVSKEPGKTRAVHLYYWREARKIVADLPGYGFAKASKDERERWSRFIQAYLSEDQALERALVLLDSRHGPTELDTEAIRFLSFEGVPVTLVFTKVDALKTQAERARRKKEADEALRKLGFDPGLAHWVSSETKDGLKRLARELGDA